MIFLYTYMSYIYIMYGVHMHKVDLNIRRTIGYDHDGGELHGSFGGIFGARVALRRALGANV